MNEPWLILHTWKKKCENAGLFMFIEKVLVATGNEVYKSGVCEAAT